MLCSLSNLDDRDLDRIRTLENEMGKTLLAYSCHRASPSDLADGELDKIRSLEKDLGLALVAVDA